MGAQPSHHQIIFDLGNVLIRWDPRKLYRKIFRDDEGGMEWFLANVCNAAWNEQLDSGLSFADAIQERTRAFPKYADQIRAYQERWFETLGDPIGENVALLKDLREIGYKVYALTNWSAETFYPAQKRFEFLGWFEGVVVSGEERLIKPDPRIYHLLLSRYNLRANSAIFMDDSLKNIEAARSIGIDAIHFSEGVDLRQELRRRNVLVDRNS